MVLGPFSNAQVGFTALAHALEEGWSLNCVRFLIERGADVETVDDVRRHYFLSCLHPGWN